MTVKAAAEFTRSPHWIDTGLTDGAGRLWTVAVMTTTHKSEYRAQSAAVAAMNRDSRGSVMRDSKAVD